MTPVYISMRARLGAELYSLADSRQPSKRLLAAIDINPSDTEAWAELALHLVAEVQKAKHDAAEAWDMVDQPLESKSIFDAKAVREVRTKVSKDLRNLAIQRREEGFTLREIADILNEKGSKTAFECNWTESQVRRLLLREGRKDLTGSVKALRETHRKERMPIA